MYIRPLKNRSGSISIQVISKARGKYKVVKTVGCATTQHEIEKLTLLAKQQIEELGQQTMLFLS